MTLRHTLNFLLYKWLKVESFNQRPRIANRPKDRLDIEALEKIKRGESPDV